MILLKTVRDQSQAIEIVTTISMISGPIYNSNSSNHPWFFSTWKRLFDLPTETKDKEKAKEKGGKFAGGVSASISRKRFAVPKKVDDALVVDDDGDLKRAILAISAM